MNIMDLINHSFNSVENSVYVKLIQDDLSPALESYAEGGYVVDWMIDNHPSDISFLDTTRVRESSKGYYNKDGWVSYRGRFIPFPRVYHARDVVKRLQTIKDKFWRIDEYPDSDSEYIRLMGNIFSDHNNQKYPTIKRFFVYVNAKEWNKLSKEAQWNYMRDLCTNGYKTNYSTRKAQEDKLRKVLKKALWEKALDATKEGNLRYFPTEYRFNQNKAKEYYNFYAPLIERSLLPRFYEERIHSVCPYVYPSLTLCYPWYNNPEWIDFEGNNDLSLENKRAREMEYPIQRVRYKAHLYEGYYVYTEESPEVMIRKGYLRDVTPPSFIFWLSHDEIVEAYGEEWFDENIPDIYLKLNR